MTDLQRIIWLSSYPKSGNTWTRVFLANYFLDAPKGVDINRLNEFTTADVRMDFFDRAAGGRYAGETFDDWVMLRPAALRLIAASKPGHHFVKTHCPVMRIADYDLIPPEVTAAAIYILRNPFDMVASYAQHMGRGIDDTIARVSDPKNLNYTGTLIFEILGRWDRHVEGWTCAPGLPRHVMRYEDMVSDPERAFRGLLGFLRAPVRDGALRRAIRASSFKALKKQEEEKGFREKPPTAQAFFRKGQVGSWREELTPAQVAAVRDAFLPAIERWYPELVEETAKIAARA